MVPGEGTFLSGQPSPARTTVNCPPPPGAKESAFGAKRVATPTCARAAPAERQMAPADSAGGMALPSSGWPPTVTAVPALLFGEGKVYRAGAGGPFPLLDGRGRGVDVFDVIDGLAAHHKLLYLVDLGALQGRQAQLDYLQELSRDVTLWVDAGVHTAEQAIDVLVAGAEKATLSASRLRGPEDLRRAWELSTSLLFEIEIWADSPLRAGRSWNAESPDQLARTARGLGPTEILLSFRGIPPDWALVRAVSEGGPTWVSADLSPSDSVNLLSHRAAGAIYPLRDELLEWIVPPDQA